MLANSRRNGFGFHFEFNAATCGMPLPVPHGAFTLCASVCGNLRRCEYVKCCRRRSDSAGSRGDCNTRNFAIIFLFTHSRWRIPETASNYPAACRLDPKRRCGVDQKSTCLTSQNDYLRGAELLSNDPHGIVILRRHLTMSHNIAALTDRQ